MLYSDFAARAPAKTDFQNSVCVDFEIRKTLYGTVLCRAEAAQPPTLPASDEEPFVQRSGDAALVSVGGATVLIVRVDEEWRLRDVFAAEPPL